MLRNVWLWILNNVFHISTETTTKELEDNQKYSVEYERIDEINFNSIFSNKLANYVISDSNLNITGENERADLLNKIGQSLWKKMKKITSMGFGYGGIFLVPYVKGNKLFYSVVPQGRVIIDNTDGDLITGITILAEKKVITQAIGQDKVYMRWTNYRLENGNCIIEQKFTDETGRQIPIPSFWQNIMLKQTITNVDRVLAGYIKSPINNRKSNDKYGVPITYGCEATIKEIKECMKQLQREYELKQAFVGADSTMFNGKDALPLNGLFKKIDSGEDTFFEVFDPAFRPYTDRLQELYKRLEHEIGTSAGIISEVQTQNATATEIKKAMYDTFTITDDMRSNIEKGLEDFFYACNVLANAYNLSAMGEYELGYDWSYSLLEDTQAEFNQLMQAESRGIIDTVEIRQWLKPNETLEESQQAIDKIKQENPSISDLIGSKVEE
jgi:hypothetical protein